jgi:glycosyltransferase involved in cell wall biosynthesis
MGRVCVVRQLYFPRDAKCRREVDALLAAGHEIDVVCLRRRGEPLHERYGRANLWRIPISHRRGRMWVYILEYVVVLFFATLLVGALHLRRRYDVIQVNTPPDSLVFAALIPRLLGARVLLQLQEPMPEFFSTKFGAGQSRMVRAVAWMEQRSVRFADFVVTCTEHMRAAFVARGAPPSKIAVIVPTSNEDEFDPARATAKAPSADRFVLVSHGSIEERYGLDTVIRAVRLLRDEIPGIRLEIYGEGTYTGALKTLAQDLDVAASVSFHGWVPIAELVQAIADADAGVVAMKRDAFRDLTHCLKMYDFISMRRPAIVSRTTSVDEYFGDDVLQKFIAADEHDLARAIRELRCNPARGTALVENASEATEHLRWKEQRQLYLDIVARLVAGGRAVTLDQLRTPEPTGGVS